MPVVLAFSDASAEEIRQMVLANSPAFEAAAAPLRSAPAQEYEFSQAVLGDVLRLLAHDSGISFFSLPSDADGADKLVTFNITSSPFKSLETLSAANGIALIYDSGIWYMRPANDKELIGRTYQIKYNSLETVTSEVAAASAAVAAAVAAEAVAAVPTRVSTFRAAAPSSKWNPANSSKIFVSYLISRPPASLRTSPKPLP